MISLSYKLAQKANEEVSSQNVTRILKYKVVVGKLRYPSAITLEKFYINYFN